MTGKLHPVINKLSLIYLKKYLIKNHKTREL